MTEKRVSQVIGEVAEVPTTVQRRVSQVIAEVAYTPSADPLVPPSSGGGSVGAAGGAAPVQHTERSPQWTVDGKPANLVWRSVRMRANGGWESADFILPRTRSSYGTTTVLGPHDFEQGAIVRALRDNGDIFYEGKVAAPPKRFQGETHFYTVGAVEEIRRRATRLPYQLAGASNWVERTADPFNYNNNQKYGLFSKGKLLGWHITKDETYPTDHKAGYALMVANWPLQRIAFTLNKSADINDFDLALWVADDAGTLSLDHTWQLGGGNPDGTTFDWNLVTPSNTLSLVVNCASNSTPTNTTKIWLTHLRVNGMTTDDSYTTSDVVADVANRCAFNVDNVAGSAIQALPLDWNGPWSELADAMGQLDDWVWVVGADPTGVAFGSMSYAPYGGIDGERIWRGSTGEGLQVDVDVLPLYNHVDVQYESPAGMPQTLEREVTDIADLIDPVPDNTYPYPDPFIVDDPQDDNSLPKAIADNALHKFSQIRCLGQVDISWLDNGRPYDVAPGDLLQIGGFQPPLPPQRITGVEYKVDGTVSVDIGQTIDVAEIIGQTTRHRFKGGRRGNSS